MGVYHVSGLYSQEGWLCQEENIAQQPLSAQTGWLFKLDQNI